MNEITIILEGDVPSNKNSLVTRLSNAVITHLRTIIKELHDKSKTNKIIKSIAKYCRVTHTNEYKEWFTEARKQIAEQVDREPLWDKVHIDFTIYFPRHGISGGDISNKQQSIEDVLVACAIISDDNYECLTSYSASGHYREKGGAVIKIKKI